MKLLLEDLDSDYIKRVHQDLLTFLKNVNRLKTSDAFFELLDYWIYWMHEEFDLFTKKVSGKNTLGYQDIQKELMVGRIVARLEKTLYGLFWVDSADYTKFVRKNYELNSGVDINLINQTINSCLTNKENFDKELKGRMHRDYIESSKRDYFEVWSFNANSRYISSKKIIDDVFDELNSLFISDKYIEEFIERNGVKIKLYYEESLFDQMYYTIKIVESALNIFDKTSWGKKLISSLKLSIDFVNPQAKYDFIGSSGKKYTAAGF